MSLLWASIRSRNNRAMKAWCSLNRPVKASVSAGIFERILRWARSASTAGQVEDHLSIDAINCVDLELAERRHFRGRAYRQFFMAANKRLPDETTGLVRHPCRWSWPALPTPQTQPATHTNLLEGEPSWPIARKGTHCPTNRYSQGGVVVKPRLQGL